MKRTLVLAVAMAAIPACGKTADESRTGAGPGAGPPDESVLQPDASIGGPDAPVGGDATPDRMPDDHATSPPDAGAPPADASSPGVVVCDFVDAGPGAPPPYCVAPCLWQAISRCMPVLDECLVDEPIAGLAAIRCDPQSGWSVHSGYLGNGSWVHEVRRGGELCYGVRYGVRPITAAQYWGPDGPIAFQRGVWGSPVYCTTSTLVEIATSMQLPPDTIGCKMERDRPECAEWNEFGYPVGNSCASETPGSCRDDGGP